VPQRFVISDAKKSMDAIADSIAKKSRFCHSTYTAATRLDRFGGFKNSAANIPIY